MCRDVMNLLNRAQSPYLRVTYSYIYKTKNKFLINFDIHGHTPGNDNFHIQHRNFKFTQKCFHTRRLLYKSTKQVNLLIFIHEAFCSSNNLLYLFCYCCILFNY